MTKEKGESNRSTYDPPLPPVPTSEPEQERDEDKKKISASRELILLMLFRQEKTSVDSAEYKTQWSTLNI